MDAKSNATIQRHREELKVTLASSLQQIASSPDGAPLRYDAFHAITTGVLFYEPLPLPEEAVTILKQSFAENPEESAFLRAYACHLIGIHYKSLKQLADALPYFDASLDLCKTVPAKTRRQMVSEAAGEGCDSIEDMRRTSVDKILERIQGHASFCKKLILDPKGANLEACAESDDAIFRQPGVASEMWEMIQSFSDPADFLRRPPTITSDVMAKVKALPEVDKTFLVFDDGNTSIDKESEDCNPILREAHRNGVNFRVCQVNLERFHAGKRNKVFKPVVMGLICDRRCSRPNNLLSTFVVACQESFKMIPASKQVEPPERPKKVLFQSKEDANHPQIISFLTMMGCSDVSAADPTLLELLEETKNDIFTMKELLRKQKDELPHLYDLERNIACGGCRIVGPTLKECECGKAYYCSEACQRRQWQEHKAAHKKGIARKLAKSQQPR